MEIKCPICAKSIVADDINIQTGLAICRECNKGFSVILSQTVNKKKLGPIKGIKVYRTGHNTVVELAWFSAKAYGLLFFTVFWNAIIFGVVFGTEPKMYMTVFAILPLFGIAVAYLTLCHFVNKTKFIVERDFLILKHGPLPCGFKEKIPKYDINQVYVKEKVEQAEGRSGHKLAVISYSLEVLLKSGDRRSLITDSFYEKLLKIEQELEAALGITDTPVRGEPL
ncbi:MAG: hypothetical protein KDD37_09465 [Bdellovibrionales bacterium]|nr:hypothetical protein [Bdellovibrionales bacterium]